MDEFFILASEIRPVYNVSFTVVKIHFWSFSGLWIALCYFILFVKLMDRVDLDKNRDDESLDWENTRAMSFVYNSMFRKPTKTSLK